MSMGGSLRAGGPTPPCAVTGRPFPWRTGTIKSMRDRARGAGVRTVAYALMDDHIHWIVIAESRAALAAATRLVFGQLARRINRVAGRVRGRVFADRFLRSVFGPRGPDRDALLVRMLTERVPFVPLAVRRQASLPSLG